MGADKVEENDTILDYENPDEILLSAELCLRGCSFKVDSMLRTRRGRDKELKELDEQLKLLEDTIQYARKVIQHRKQNYRIK